MANQLKLAVRKLKTIYSELESITLFGTLYDTTSGNINEVRVRMECLPGISEQFEICQTQIEELDDAVEDDDHIAKRIEFKDKLYSAKALLMQLLDAHLNSTSSSPSYSELTKYKTDTTMRLPPVDIPKFDGDWQKWTSFIDSFNAMFHHNESLAPVQKFHYLKSCLQGQPSDVIRSIPTTGQNYLQAYQALTNRYENKGVIIQSHIRSLLDTPKVSIASATNLQKLHHHVMSNVNALKALEQPVEAWDAWLVTLTCCRLDSVTVGEWQLQYNKKDLPSFKAIEAFLFNRIAAYEAGDINVGLTTEKKSLGKFSNPKVHEKKVFFARPADKINNASKCILCSEIHRLYQCKKFNDLSVPERREAVSRNRLCFKCLYANHQAWDCKFSNCPKCGQRHNSKLHLEEIPQKSTPDKNDAPGISEQSMCTTEFPTQSMHASGNSVILATAVVYVNDIAGVPQPCRALLDSGSQVNFITDACAQSLNLPRTKCHLPIVGINSMKSNVQKLKPVVVSSRHNNFSTEIILHVIPYICNELPSHHLKKDHVKIPEIVKDQLADPGYGVPGEINLLLGAEVFYTLFIGDKIDIESNLTFHKTLLGWVLTGKVFSSQFNHFETSAYTCFNEESTNSALSLLVTKANIRRSDEELVEKHFKDTHYRDESGRFVVRLPFNDNVSLLGESSYMAQRRFLNLERRLCKDKDLGIAYHKFIAEYLDMNHMNLINDTDPGKKTYYLPHHAVTKETSITTKLRVVFDGSAPSSTGLSLNDVLYKGPKVQPDLLAILLRFRMHAVVMTSDIVKMYRQILIHPDDRALQRIWYRKCPEQELQEFELRTVTYGTKAASFLSTRCLVQLAVEVKDPSLKRVITSDFYVDDLLTGCPTVDECYARYKALNEVLERACLPLRKWCSNSKELMSLIPTNMDDPTYRLCLTDQDRISTLGLSWQPNTDTFHFVLGAWNPPAHMTKRSLLSDINRIYDPIGLITPVLIKGKIFLQQLWLLKMNWDSTLSADLQARWVRFYSSLKSLDKLSIPRKVIFDGIGLITLHGFCDASQEAYGACIYVRTQRPDGTVYVQLLTSKSRVAPMSTTTIPRLELCGALLLSELVVEVKAELSTINFQFSLADIVLWTDSTVVLGWIQSAVQLKSFVANRITQILDNTERTMWRHVPTSSNPADIITRGIHADELVDQNHMWWNGPSWLLDTDELWPVRLLPEEDLPEVRPIKLVLVATNVDTGFILNRCSKWLKLIHVTAYVRRFIFNCRKNDNNQHLCHTISLTIPELNESKLWWLRRAQAQDFNSEIKSLQKEMCVGPRSCLKSLNPYLDDDNLIRVGGRLTYAPISERRKCPIVLSSKNSIVKMLFHHEHIHLLHIGPQGLLAHIQRTYWPIRGRNLARQTVHKCITCFRSKPQLLQPVMAPLPSVRVTQCRAFENAGVDLCGPINVRSGLRKITPLKHYIAVFVCMVTRAIHLELVRDLSSDAFMSALFRFISRRGQCVKLYSDNGTNFTGTKKVLDSWASKLLNETNSNDQLSKLGIEWRFIPPAAPNFGGLWESAVKSAKQHLVKSSNGALLTYEET
ncbi:uncharacterized protein LOC112680475, partial [Sipha flava]|uniref:Uncharacterized protein LOC112680475 n=1 Tax=Sipha flava TaxID=143950 RepID=A0A8B8F782_9HEMI